MRPDFSISYAMAALVLIGVSLYLSLIGPAVEPRQPVMPVAPAGITITLAQDTSASVR